MGKMPLFSFLNKKTLNKYEKTEEYQFYMKNKEYLLPLNFHYHLVFSENNAFKIIQANILIKAMMNKEIYDETLKRSQDELLTIIDGRNEYLKERDHHLLMKRVANVVDDFYSNERKKFVRSLRDNGLISSKMCSILLRKESIRSIRRTKVALKGKSIDEIL